MGKLTINRGTTFTIDIVYQKDGQPASLVGATIRFTIKSTEYDAVTNDSTALVQKTVTVHTDAPAGISSIALVPSDTATIEPGTYFYDVKVEEANTDIYKIDEGKVKLDGSPTNRLS